MIEQLGGVLTVTVLLQLLVHPLELVTVTEYVPVEPTVIHCVVAPVLHKYPASPAGAHNCTVLPKQQELFPVIEQLGGVYVVTVLLQVLVHPFASVIVTE